MSNNKAHPPSFEDVLARFPKDEQDDVRRLWAASADLDDAPAPDPRRMANIWDTLQHVTQLPADRPATPPKSARILRLSRLAWPVAATLLLAAVGLFWWMQPVVIDIAAGQSETVALPDGSTVQLNSGSHLRYARSFSDARSVELAGEAFFDVVHDDRPFTVNTFNAHVEVLGTTFNVKAWPESTAPATTVTLETGSVRLAAGHDARSVVLMEPGETRRVAENSAPSPADTLYLPQALAWRAGDFVFIAQPLSTVLEDIERRFNVDIAPLAPELALREVTFAQRKPADARSVIASICHALDLNYRETVNGFSIESSE